METASGPIPGQGRLRTPVLPPWPRAPKCKLAVPGGGSDVRYWKEAQGSQETCFKLRLQGHSERECRKLMAKLPSQCAASREKGQVRPHTSPSLQAHLVLCPEKAGMGRSSLERPRSPGWSWPSGPSARNSRVWYLIPRWRKGLRYMSQKTSAPGQLSQLPEQGCSTPLPPPPSLISGISPDPVPPRDRLLLPVPQGTSSSEPVECPAKGR